MLINCDLGECLIPNLDAKIMPHIAMASIACGGHSGNNKSMLDTVLLAKKYGVTIGAHISYLDKKNFGRISQNVSDDTLYKQIIYQMRQLETICINNKTKISYIKPHGALYHDMMNNNNIIAVIIKLIKEVNTELKLVMQYGINSPSIELAKNNNIALLYEVFADRGYMGKNLIPRNKDGAILGDKKIIIEQLHAFSRNKEIDTICFHSDNKASVAALINNK